jgi:hypothetical protein
MTSHRNAVGCLSEDPAVEGPIPPDAQMDRFSVAGGSSGTELDVLANDTDYSCEALSINAFDATTARGGTVTLVGTGATVRLRYTPAAGFFGSDTFNYTLRAVRATCPEAPWRVFPGVSSYAAIAAATRFPLGEGKERVLILPCPEAM